MAGRGSVRHLLPGGPPAELLPRRSCPGRGEEEEEEGCLYPLSFSFSSFPSGFGGSGGGETSVIPSIAPDYLGKAGIIP